MELAQLSFQIKLIRLFVDVNSEHEKVYFTFSVVFFLLFFNSFEKLLDVGRYLYMRKIKYLIKILRLKT